MSGRKLAVQLLCRTEQDQSYSNLLLDHELSKSNLEDAQRRLCAMLYYGVMERRITLDAAIQHYSKKPLERLDAAVRNILRLGVFQLCFCDQIPQHAAVSECVKLTRSLRKASASGFVNGVLRQFLRDGCEIPYPKDPAAAIAVRYAVPAWLLQRLTAAYGQEKTERFLADALLPAPRYIRRNPMVCTAQQLETALGEQITPVALIPDAYRLHTGAGDIRRLPQFQQGWFHVQDLASQLCALSLEAKPGETVLDVCAAPGGKTCTIAAQMQNQGKIYAYDLAPHRVELIRKNATRLGLTCITAAQGDARELAPAIGQADRVLCDVPCSGIGVLRRKPEVKEKDPAAFADLPALQLAILTHAATLVKPGGTLVYSTCTLLPEENEDVVAAFLAQHPVYRPAPVLPKLGEPFTQSAVTLLPEVCGSDGFFMAKFQRN